MAKTATIAPDKEAVIDVAVEKAVCLINGLLANTVMTYWGIGDALLGLDTKYGEGAVKDFGVKLAARAGRNEAYNYTSLYRALQFREKFSPEQRDALIKNGVSWTQIVQVLPAPAEIVDQCIKRLDANELEPQKFAAAVKQTQEAMGEGGESKVSAASIGAGEGDDDLDTSDKDSDSETDAGDGKAKTGALKREVDRITSVLDSAVDVMGDIILWVDKAEKSKPAVPLAVMLKEISGRLDKLAEAGGAAKRAVKGAGNGGK